MIRYFAAIALVAMLACNRPASTGRLPEMTIRLGASSAAGNFYSDGIAVAEAVENLVPHTHVEVATVGGGFRNVDLLRERKIDLAFSFSNVAYAAYMGELESSAPAFRELRGVAVLELAPLHLLVGPHSTIHTVSDLRGKTVNPGGPGSGAAQAFKVVSQAYGLQRTVLDKVGGGYDEAVKRLSDGKTDAMFVLAGYPSEPVLRAINAGAHLIPIAGPEIERVRADYQFFVPALIPVGGYPGVTTAIHTIGVESLLLCRSDLDEGLVHDLTAAMFNPQGTAAAELRHRSDVRQAAATPIPLHPGAARYYRERELSR